MRRGFRCRREVFKRLKTEYDRIVELEYDGNSIVALQNFDKIAEEELRGLLKYFYESRRSRDQAWKTCKGSLYEYATFRALTQIVSGNKTLNEKLEVLMGDEAILQHKDQVVIKNWSEIFPDVDILIVEKETGNVIAILSCKTSLRERLTETAFWKRELEKNPRTKEVKLLFVTTDKDNELKTDTNRYILLHVIDCTFVTDPKKYKELILIYEQRYGDREDFNKLVPKIREISKIEDYLLEIVS